MSFSQNLEEQVVKQYFGGFKGRLLDLGCNDGRTFSNSLGLINFGWHADLVDGSPTMADVATKFHSHNKNVNVYNFAISNEDKMGVLHESGAHVPNGIDYSLVSTLDVNEKQRWSNVSFKEVDVQIVCFDTFYKLAGMHQYDFISIDIESEDWNVLQQIDLTAVGCKCLCIEWNSRRDLERLFTSYCHSHNMVEIHRNAENIILAV